MRRSAGVSRHDCGRLQLSIQYHSMVKKIPCFALGVTPLRSRPCEIYENYKIFWFLQKKKVNRHKAIMSQNIMRLAQLETSEKEVERGCCGRFSCLTTRSRRAKELASDNLSVYSRFLGTAECVVASALFVSTKFLPGHYGDVLLVQRGLEFKKKTS